MFQTLTFLLLNSALALNAVFWLLLLTRGQMRERTKFFFSAFILYISQIIVIEIVLGIFDSISYLNVSIAGYSIFLVSLIIFLFRFRKNLSFDYLGAVQSPKKGGRGLGMGKPRHNFILRHPLFFAVFAPLIFLLIVRAFDALLQAPLEYDSVAYHLPFVMEWLHTGSLRQVYYSAFAGPISYYPSTYELLDLWAILSFHNDFLVNLLNFPLMLIFGMAIYKILRNFAVQISIALTTTGLLLFMPVILRQAGLPLVDLFFVLTFALALYFLQEIYKKLYGKGDLLRTKEKVEHLAGAEFFDGSTVDILLFSLSLGLFMGTKYLGIVMIPPLMLILFVLLFLRKKNWRTFVKDIFIAFVGIFVTGSFFYLRNWISSGNPLFPLEIKLGSFTIFHGYLGLNDQIASTTLATNLTSLEKLKEFFEKIYLMVGLQGLVMGATLVLTLFFVLFRLFQFIIRSFRSENLAPASTLFSVFTKKRKKSSLLHDVVIGTLLLGASLVYIYLYFKSPYSYRDLVPNVRYALPLLVLLTLNIGFLVSRVKILRPLFFGGSFFMISFAILFLIVYPPKNLLDNDRMILDFGILQHYKTLFVLFLGGLLALFLGIRFIVGRSREFRKNLSFDHVGEVQSPKKGGRGLGMEESQNKFIFPQNSSYRKWNIFFGIICVLLSFFLLGKVAATTVIEREKLISYFYQSWYNVDQHMRDVMAASLWLDEHAPHAKIAYSGFNFHYHLYGRDLSREVDYVNINTCSNCRYVDFKDTPGSIRANPDQKAWFKNLSMKQKEFLVLQPELMKDIENFEFEWAKADPKHFQEVFHQNSVYIYKIVYP